MSSSTQVFFTGSSSRAGVSYSTTTLTASLTTAFTTESVYTNYGEEETSTFLVATVIGPGTEVINETTTGTPSTKKKTIIIVAAALGGFIALVVVGLIILGVTRRRRRKRPHMITPATPTLGYASPNLPPASLTPFGYQSPEHAQPHEPLLMNESPNVGMYPPSVTSEKRKKNLLQRPQVHQRGPSEATITTTSASSIRSQPQTTTSGISSSPPPTGFHQPIHKSRPPHSHQRSHSGGSEAASFSGPDRRTSVGSTGPTPSMSRVPVSTPPYFGPPPSHPGGPTAPMIHEETPPVTPMQNQGFQQYGQHQLYQQQDQNQQYQQPHHTQGFYHQGQDQGYTSTPSNAPAPGGPYNRHPQHQTSFHAQNVPAGQNPTYSASVTSSSLGAGGSRDPANVIGATVDRGDGEAAQVFSAKNNMRNEPRRRDDDINDSATNLTELPPAYASLRPRNP